MPSWRDVSQTSKIERQATHRQYVAKSQAFDVPIALRPEQSATDRTKVYVLNDIVVCVHECVCVYIYIYIMYAMQYHV